MSNRDDEMFGALKPEATLLSRIEACLSAEDGAEALALVSNGYQLASEKPSLQIELQLLHAQCLFYLGRFGELFDILEKLGLAELSQSQELSAALIQAHACARVGKLDIAIAKSRSVLSMSSPHSAAAARANYVLGLCLYRRGHYKWAHTLFARSAGFYRIAQDNPELANMLNNISLIQKSQGGPRNALQSLEEAMSLISETQYPRHLRRILCNRGLCLLKLGRVMDARDSFIRAKKLAVVAPDRFLDVGLNNSLGHIYRIQGQYEVAREFYEAALETARSEGSLRQECLSLEFLGELYTAMEEPKAALSYLNKAWKLAKRIAPHGDLMMEVLRRRGEARLLAGDHREAMNDVLGAKDLCKSRGERREWILCLRAEACCLGPESPRAKELVHQVLNELLAIDDKLEFVISVDCFRALERGRDRVLADKTLITAQHFLNAIGKTAIRTPFWPPSQSKNQRRAESLERGQTPFGNSQPFLDCQSAAKIAARSRHPVLIRGETGSGKEVVARYLHDQSNSMGPWIAVNCGAISEGLIESELFGHVRGAFSGAVGTRVGLIETADKGTLFLDEIGELPPTLQVKLLRFLDSGEFRRVGETTIRRSGARILAATNRDLREEIKAGNFREDLFFRLSVFDIEVPPLRKRQEDVLTLAKAFLKEECEDVGARVVQISQELESWLKAYRWPGNVRELRNICRFLAVQSWGRPEIRVEDLPQHTLEHGQQSYSDERAHLEKEQLLEALETTEWQIAKAADLLGVGRNTVTRRMKRLGIKYSRTRT